MMKAHLASRSRGSRFVLFVLALSLGLVAIVHAQAPVLHFEHFPEVSYSVHDLHQDREGFLWIGSAEGLYRYDGRRFMRYAHVPGDATSLSGSSIDIIYEDRAGTLWIGTYLSPGVPGLNRYERQTDTFTRFVNDPSDPASLSASEVRAIHEDHTGVLWVGTDGGGLYRFDRETETFTRFVNDPADPGSLGANSIEAIYEDRAGALWIGLGALDADGSGRTGLDRFERQTERFTHFRHNPDEIAGIGRGEVTTMLEDSKGRFWIGTREGGLCRMERPQGTFSCYRHDPEDPTSLSDDHVTSLYEDASGTLWVGTAVSTGEGGLNRFDPETGAFDRLLHDPTKPTSLNSNNVESILQDRTGVLWIGTAGGGLDKLKHPVPVFTAYLPPARDLAAWGVLEDSTGRLWIASNVGLHRLDRESGQWTSFVHDPGDPLSLSYGRVSGLYEDRSDVLWVATGGGLDRFEEETSRFTHFRHDPQDPTTLGSNTFRSIYEDRAGRLWIGAWGGGLHILDRATGRFSRYMHDARDPTSIGPGSVTAMLEDSQGRFWIATSAGGLNLMDHETGRFTRFVHDPDDPHSLSSSDLNSLLKDAAGMLWVGTFDGGLNRFDPETGRVRRFTAENSCLPHDRVLGLLEDEEGYLWLNTGQGVVRFDPEEATCTVYGTYDGLVSLASGLGSFKSTRGEFFFGSLGGVHGFFPNEIPGSAEPPLVVLTDFRLFHQSVRPGPESVLARRITETEEVVLTHDENSVGFEFAALDFIRPEQNQYAYRLEGFEQDWVEAGSQRAASYTNLSPGAYVFRVKAANADGVWNEEGASVRLLIRPPWWRTWWAYLFYGLLLAAGVFAVDRLQRRRLIRRERTRAESEADKLRAEAAEAWTNYLQSENQRQTQELDQARHLQLSMLPECVPQHPTVELAAFMKTATEVGGDYYDFDLSDDGTLTIIIGDATGHGASAGTMVTATKGILNVLSGEEDLEQVLMAASEAVRRMHLPKLYMALALARLRDHTLEVVGAGMPPALVYRAASGCIEEVALKGMPLGSPGAYPYRRQCLLLSPGDTVVLMSDGFPELFGASGQRLGYECIAGLFAEAAGRSPEEVIAHLMETAKAWCNGHVPDDDMTFVVMKVKT